MCQSQCTASCPLGSSLILWRALGHRWSWPRSAPPHCQWPSESPCVTAPNCPWPSLSLRLSVASVIPYGYHRPPQRADRAPHWHGAPSQCKWPTEQGRAYRLTGDPPDSGEGVDRFRLEVSRLRLAPVSTGVGYGVSKFYPKFPKFIQKIRIFVQNFSLACLQLDRHVVPFTITVTHFGFVFLTRIFHVRL